MLSTSTTRNPLDLTGSDFRGMMCGIVDLLARFLDGLPHASISFPSDMTESLRGGELNSAPPEDARSLQELLRVLLQAANSDPNVASGGFLGYIPGSGLVSAAAADLISGVLNSYTGVSIGAPAMVALEAAVLRWMADLIGLPSTAGGLLTSGASMAIFSAVVCARNERLPEDFRNGVVYTTDQTHYALAKAMRLAGFPRTALRQLDVDHKLRMNTSALRDAIAEDRAAGRIPFCIAANAGTTNTGTIDPLQELAEVAREEGLWFHVDAAYGGFFQLTDRGRERLAGIEHADSVILDPHKGLFLPFGTGCLLVRDEETLYRAHSIKGVPFFRDRCHHEADMHLPDFSDLSPELTRPNRGLRLWLPLQLHGVAAFRDALDEKLDFACQVYEALRQTPQLQVFDAPDLSIVAFHCRLPDGIQEEENIATEKLVKHLNAAHRVLLSTTSVNGRVFARIAILNMRTTSAIITEVINAIRNYVVEPTMDVVRV
jgi:aromatic-L-amino-acid/L-tryptophan decarboxylase